MGNLPGGEPQTPGNIQEAFDDSLPFACNPITDPLFKDGEPRREDIKQGAIGDCYFLSSIKALVTRNPRLIKDIIWEKGGKVHVRLFHPASKDDATYFERDEYVLDKSEVRLNGNQHEAPWVFLLEKAYYLHRKKYRQESFKDIKNPTYKQVLSSGHASEAFSDVLGSVTSHTDTKHLGINYKGIFGALKEPHRLADIYMDVKNLRGHDAAQTMLKARLAVATKEEGLKGCSNADRFVLLFGRDDTGAAFAKEFVLKYPYDRYNPNLWAIIKGLGDGATPLEKNQAVNKSREDPKFLSAYLNCLDKGNPPDQTTFLDGLWEFFPRVSQGLKTAIEMRVTEAYAEDKSQNQVHTKIYGALESGNFVSASTADTDSTDKHLKGLVPGHAYEVVNCYKRGNQLFIQLSNPWGNTIPEQPDYEVELGHKTEPAIDFANMDQQLAAHPSTFELPIEDFIKYFPITSTTNLNATMSSTLGPELARLDERHNARIEIMDESRAPSSLSYSDEEEQLKAEFLADQKNKIASEETLTNEIEYNIKTMKTALLRAAPQPTTTPRKNDVDTLSQLVSTITEYLKQHNNEKQYNTWSAPYRLFHRVTNRGEHRYINESRRREANLVLALATAHNDPKICMPDRQIIMQLLCEIKCTHEATTGTISKFHGNRLGHILSKSLYERHPSNIQTQELSVDGKKVLLDQLKQHQVTQFGRSITTDYDMKMELALDTQSLQELTYLTKDTEDPYEQLVSPFVKSY
ncbi:MAG: hypothetical protein COB66_00715 [Coxiella sp. (in: Bacteria)]|nr:MAG: hypothetical protein COB66_00715 [Coxiella sp. (in: g-proteobacteria)]